MTPAVAVHTLSHTQDRVPAPEPIQACQLGGPGRGGLATKTGGSKTIRYCRAKSCANRRRLDHCRHVSESRERPNRDSCCPDGRFWRKFQIRPNLSLKMRGNWGSGPTLTRPPIASPARALGLSVSFSPRSPAPPLSWNHPKRAVTEPAGPGSLDPSQALTPGLDWY